MITRSKILRIALSSGLLLGTAGLASAGQASHPSARDYIAVRCTYPHGWNYTDSYRDINGTPGGPGHDCIVPAQGASRAYDAYHGIE